MTRAAGTSSPAAGGVTSPVELTPGVWRAQAKFRDFAGVLHKLEARGPSGAAAQRRLEDKLHNASSAGMITGAGTIAPDTRMSVVFDQWVVEKRVEGGQVTPPVVEDVPRHPGARPTSGLRSLRVREVTPVAVNRMLLALSQAQKFDTARQARNVMSQVMMMCVRYGAAPVNPPVRDAVTVRKPKRAAVRTIALEDIALLRKAVREWEDRPAAIRGDGATSRSCRRSSTRCWAPVCGSASVWRSASRTSTWTRTSPR